MSTGVPAGITDSQLAVLLRQAQWALDDATHDLPAGRATGGQREQLAPTLETLALVLRAPVPDHASHPDDKPADERRGWWIASCGCALDIPPSGAIFTDCTACAPNPTQTPADHRLSDPCTPAPGDRPDHASTPTHPQQEEVQLVSHLSSGRPLPRSEQITGRERARRQA